MVHLDPTDPFELAACGLCMLAPDNRLVRINHRALRWLGFDPALPDRPGSIDEILDAGSQATFQQLADALRAGADRVGNIHDGSIDPPEADGLHLLPAWLRHQDGRRIPVLLQLAMAGDRLQVALAHRADTSSAAAHPTVAPDPAALDSTALRRARMQALADGAPDAILSTDDEQRITYANPAASALLGCSHEELIGSDINRFIPLRFRQAHREHVRQFGESGVTARHLAGHLGVTGMRADGTEFPLEASISHLRENGRNVFNVILRDVSLRVASDRALARARERLRSLTARLQTIREEEQRRVSRELHDDIGQRLSALKMDVSALRLSLPSNRPQLFDALDQMDELLTETVAAVRRLATGLRPKILDDLGLMPALESFLHDSCKRAGLACEFSMDEAIELDESRSITIFRLVQEAIHNVAKHAAATHVWVTLTREADRLTLRVRDDGRGMVPPDEEKEGALGLVGLRERVDSLNGRMTIRSAPGQGTLIEFELPAGAAGPDSGR